MPRRQRQLNSAPFPSRSLVASSASLKGKTAERIYVTDDREWQKQAYRHYRICGEARFAAQFFGHALSKVTLYVTNDPYNPKAERLKEGPAVDTLHELFNGSEGQAAMMTSLGVHLTVAGECYLIGRKAKAIEVVNGEDVETTVDIWEIRSVLEVRTNQAKGKAARWWIKNTAPGRPDIELTTDDVVIRIWVPDPENALLADSPFRSLLPILDEIEWLTKYVFAQTSSRLGGAGVWVVPEEIDFPEPPQDPANPDKNKEMNKADSILASLADAILTPIKDPSNPAAKVPIIATAPADTIQHIKDGWVTFWTELDSEAKELRQEAIQRFALGMDLPPERVLGMGSNLGTGGGTSNGVSHWGAWQIDEDTIKLHVEPMCEVVVQALTIEYERPGSGIPTATIRYDTSDLRLRPDQSAESIVLYNLGLVSGKTVVREHRFDPDADMMKDEERKVWLMLKVAFGSATPDMVNAALKKLGVDLGPTGQADPALNQARPDPALPPPDRELPDPADSEAAALIAACDALVFRALERAGNRARQVIRDAGGEPPKGHSYAVHTIAPSPPQAAAKLLNDAWTCAPQVLAGCGADPEAVVPHLQAYVISLLTSGQPHERTTMVRYLESQL
jgi:hypothetical protein